MEITNYKELFEEQKKLNKILTDKIKFLESQIEDEEYQVNSTLTEINDEIFWNIIKSNVSNSESSKEEIEYLLQEFGTKEPCNRFDVGNCIEYILANFLRKNGFEIKELPNAKRVDLLIENYKKLSIKYF